MDSMVERVARAICKTRFLNGGDEDDDGWDSATPGIQSDYMANARAAIEAMREPTDAMREIMGSHASNGMVNWDDYHDAMIDAALKETITLPSPTQTKIN